MWPLLKYLWIEEAIVAVCVTAGHLVGDAPPSLMAVNVLTNFARIPAILYFAVALRRARPLEGGRSGRVRPRRH